MYTWCFMIPSSFFFLPFPLSLFFLPLPFFVCSSLLFFPSSFSSLPQRSTSCNMPQDAGGGCSPWLQSGSQEQAGYSDPCKEGVSQKWQYKALECN